MTELKPNHIQIDVSKFDVDELEYFASTNNPPTFEELVTHVVAKAYLEQKDSILPAKPQGLGAVVSVKYYSRADCVIYVKVDKGSYIKFEPNSYWVTTPMPECFSWRYITSGAERVEILSEGIKI